jgi:REP element-mobilizing transposase RayT
MARQWRIEYEGAFYHVLSRGIEQRDIFYDNVDRQNFLNILGRMSERFDIDIYAYVLMNNHYHLLVKTNKANLSRSLQWLGTTYTGRFNRRHDRRGHLFQGRFRSIIVENDDYLIQLSFYIHRNPVRAGLVERLANYRWSSYPAYAYGSAQPNWLNTQFLLSQFNVQDKHKAYREKVQEYAREEKRIWEDVRHGLIFGTGDFIDRIKSTYLTGEPHKEIPQQRMILKNRNLATLLSKGAEILKCDIEAFRQASRIKDSGKEERDLLIYLLWELGKYKNSEIGNPFGLGYSSVSRRVSIVKSKLEKDQELRRKYEKIKSLIKM